jgi:hypothetical protein
MPDSLELKCVFDYGTWMTDWANGAMVPRHIEIQVQQQMLVAGEAIGIVVWADRIDRPTGRVECLTRV